ncbi:hypothetical protein ABZ299_20370 [Streptomyces sp. NPDC006184]|uniref:hypothetical protein n=1 Tax=Streptomyces sp. NPDC006184 TaxID=3155455 RepID=UPI0033AAF394
MEEDPPWDPESLHHRLPHSLREISSVSLQLRSVTSEAERKQILDSFGTTIEGFVELFGHDSGFTDHEPD